MDLVLLKFCSLLYIVIKLLLKIDNCIHRTVHYLENIHFTLTRFRAFHSPLMMENYTQLLVHPSKL